MTYCHPFPRNVGYISQRFGAWPNNGINPAGGHTADDWAVNEGTPVHAAGDGVVVFAGEFDTTYEDNFGWNLHYGGLMVVLNMDGDTAPYFEYGHNSALLVTTGQRVSKGQVIALSGNTDGGTGVSTGPHCHVGCLPAGFTVHTPTYGRVDPSHYFDEWVDDLTTNTETDDDMPITQDDANLIAQTILGTKWQGAPNAVLGELLNEYRAQHLTLVKVVAEALGIDESKLVDQLLNKGDVTISKR